MADRQLFNSRHQAASRIGTGAGAGAGAGAGPTTFARTRAPANGSSTALNGSLAGPAAASNSMASTASASAASTATVALGALGASGAPATIRRNLFQSHLRRPDRPDRPDDDRRALERKERDRTDRIARLEREREKELEALEKLESGPVEIVVRDRNGDVVLLDPPSPSADELNEMMAAAPLDARQESERERQRLADTIKYHQQRINIPGQPEELLDALRASLRAKVAALSEDNWMYEPEDMPRME